MNKRQAKKNLKKLHMWCGLDSVPNRCFSCEFYESADYSVGFNEGCVAPYLYDTNGDFIERLNDKAIEHLGNKGWGCPHFCLVKGKTQSFKVPRKYKDIKKLISVEK